MKKFLLSAATAVLAGLLGACSPSVNVEQRAGTDFAKYHTYAWAETEVKTDGDQNPLLRSPIAQANIQQAIEAELAQRGIRRVESNPDFYLTSHFYVEQAERTIADTPPAQYVQSFPYLVRYRGALLPVNYGYWYQPRTRYRTQRYREGTLVLDFVDAQNMNLVWRGSIADPVDDPSRLGKQFTKAAREILEKFPVDGKR